MILIICKRICSDGDNGDDNDPYNDDDDDADNMQENLRGAEVASTGITNSSDHSLQEPI